MTDKKKSAANENEITDAGAVELEEGALDAASGGVTLSTDIAQKYNIAPTLSPTPIVQQPILPTGIKIGTKI
jgi:hypothetical protein